MVKIALDAGHGFFTAGKRTPDDEREWTFNNKVLLACADRLKQFENVQILRTDDPTGTHDITLTARVNMANSWNVDVLVSIHHNALKSVWGSHGGVETFVSKNASKASKDIAAIIQPRIVKAMSLRDRGVKSEDWYVIKESKMPAILTEGGFMDSTTDIHMLRSDARLKAQGEAIADGLAQYFKLVPKQKKDVQVSNTPSPSHKESWEWATKKGFVNGERPKENVTREQLTTVLHRLYKDLGK